MTFTCLPPGGLFTNMGRSNIRVQIVTYFGFNFRFLSAFTPWLIKHD